MFEEERLKTKSVWQVIWIDWTFLLSSLDHLGFESMTVLPLDTKYTRRDDIEFAGGLLWESDLKPIWLIPLWTKAAWQDKYKVSAFSSIRKIWLMGWSNLRTLPVDPVASRLAEGLLQEKCAHGATVARPPGDFDERLSVRLCWITSYVAVPLLGPCSRMSPGTERITLPVKSIGILQAWVHRFL